MCTEDDEGVWVSAAACMRNYLILRDKVRKFRIDPEVIEALAASRVEQLREPTLAGGETWRDVRDAAIDIPAFADRGMDTNGWTISRWSTFTASADSSH